jgi:WD40 repeat protein
VADDAQILAIPSREGWGGLAWGGLSFSPDGRFLHLHRDPGGRVTLYRLDGPAAEVVLTDATGPTTWAVAFSPDSRFFAVGHVKEDDRPGSVAVYDLKSTKKDKEKKHLRAGWSPFQLAFRPGQPHLAVAGGEVVRVFSLEDGQPLFRKLTHTGGVESLAWHPDGRTLATTSKYDLRIRLWDVAAGRLLLPPLAGHHKGGMVVAFNPAGDCLLSNDWSSTLRLWDPRTGRQLLRAPSTANAFSRDGSLLGLEVSGSGVRLLRVTTRRPLRCLTLSDASGPRPLFGARASPDGRLLLVNRGDALAFVDWAGGTQVASIPLPGTTAVWFDPASELLTSGLTGRPKRAELLRWPVRAEPEAGRLHVGPPEHLHESIDPTMVPGCSADGRVLAIPRRDNPCAVVLHRSENRRVPLGPREDTRSCAVSPDRRWVATGNHSNLQGIGATVWDAKNGKKVKDFLVGGLCAVGFSPYGRWLITNGGGFRLWKVDTWQEGPPIAQADDTGGGFSFAPDGRMLALSGSFSQVRLVNPHTGAEIARLTVPEQTRVSPQCFSPDGAQLVAVGTESDLLYIWDLRALRAELKELRLDWHAPPYPKADPAAPAPLEVRVALADDVLGPAGLNDEAWRLVTDPAEQRDPARALRLIQKAVKHEPVEATLWNTLGVALYRNGQYREAVAALEKSLAAGKGQSDAFDLFFLAMCHAKLGDAAKAKDCYERAVNWFEAQKSLPAHQVEELKAFRTEAAETILGAP